MPHNHLSYAQKYHTCDSLLFRSTLSKNAGTASADFFLAVLRLGFVVLLSASFLRTDIASAQNQLPNLEELPGADRFPLSDRIWPSALGEADVCVWEGDKLCALSLSAEDKPAQVEVWLERAAQVGFPMTWFVTTDPIGTGNTATTGTWELWADVLAKGHDVQSRTKRGLREEITDVSVLEQECSGSKAAIETNLPGHLCEFVAIPNAKSDRSVLGRFFAGGRGGAAHGLNPPNHTDYFAVKIGTFNMGLTNDHSDLLSLFNPSNAKYYRAWAAPRFTTVKDWAEVEHYFEFIRGRRADVWVGRFGDISKYGQERDTASLAILSTEEAGIGFVLSDQMMDSRFDYPLTVKVRLPDAWKSVVAKQGSKPVPCQFVRHEGAPYVLVSAVPDRGAVKIAEADSPTPGGSTYAQWLREHWLPADLSGLGAMDAVIAADGITNIEKFALGLDPRMSGYDGRLWAGKSDDSTYVELGYRRPYPRPAGVKYTVEACSELLPWSATGLKETSSVVADGIETVTVCDATAAAPGKPERYMRLKVEAAP